MITYARDSLLVYHDYIITWDIQLKTALTFKNIITEGNELSGGITLTLVSGIDYLQNLGRVELLHLIWICKSRVVNVIRVRSTIFKKKLEDLRIGHLSP